MNMLTNRMQYMLLTETEKKFFKYVTDNGWYTCDAMSPIDECVYRLRLIHGKWYTYGDGATTSTFQFDQETDHTFSGYAVFRPATQAEIDVEVELLKPKPQEPDYLDFKIRWDGAQALISTNASTEDHMINTWHVGEYVYGNYVLSGFYYESCGTFDDKCIFRGTLGTCVHGKATHARLVRL